MLCCSSIGKSVEGREIYVVKLSYESTVAEAIKPRVAVVAGINGNEAVSYEMAIALVSYLLQNKDNDSSINQVSNVRYCSWIFMLCSTLLFFIV